MRNLELRQFDTENPGHVAIINNFYKDNPSKWVSFEADEGPASYGYDYYGLFSNEHNILCAITSVEHLSRHLAKTWSTIVLEGLRGKGYGNTLNQMLEESLVEQGYGKIATHIYVDNLPSLILKLKRGYLIEGTLMNHDDPGQHEYILGKRIG